MIITLDQLNEHGACEDAMIEFYATVGRQTADIKWTPAAQGWVMADPLWRRWLGWGWCNSIMPMWSIAKANLRRADLSWADLRRANLSEAISNDSTKFPTGYKRTA